MPSMSHPIKKLLWYFSLLKIDAKKLQIAGIKERTAQRIANGSVFPSGENLRIIINNFPFISLNHILSDNYTPPNLSEK